MSFSLKPWSCKKRYSPENSDVNMEGWKIFPLQAGDFEGGRTVHRFLNCHHQLEWAAT